MKMLLILKSLSLLSGTLIFSFYMCKKQLFFTLLTTEIIVIILIIFLCLEAVLLNSVIAAGLGICVFILGSLEIALILIILLL